MYEAGRRSLDHGEASVTAIPLLANVTSALVYRVVREASERLEPHPGGPVRRSADGGRSWENLAAVAN